MPKMPNPAQSASLIAGLAVFLSCSDTGNLPGPGGPALECTIPIGLIHDGAGKDEIPALTDPRLVAADDIEADYLLPEDRVVGTVIDGHPVAVPLNVGRWHEIVNFNLGGLELAITHCPLTGSSMVFDRGTIAGADFGVSGLLYLNNLVMYDRRQPESLWPQMARGARCGDASGSTLTMLPSLELTWQGWQTIHPNTLVVSSNTGFLRDYRQNPYAGYDDPISNSELPFSIPFLDRRRPPKERVLGVPSGDGTGGVAFPFGALEGGGPANAVHHQVDGASVVAFWDRNRQAAAAFRPIADGQELTFHVVAGKIRDNQTDSEWRVDGLAVDGTMAGQRLDQIPESFVSYWFAWAAFHTQTDLWEGATP